MIPRQKVKMNNLVILIWVCSSLQLIYCQTNVARTEFCPSSPECSCCLVSSPCPCGGQCQDGYFGGRCRNKCPDKCVRCTLHPEYFKNPIDSTYWNKGYCTECKPGYYSTTELYQCQYNCPAGCQTCTSATECTSCRTGYTSEGTSCTPCKTGCAVCSPYSYNCTQCQTGYYNSGGVTGNLNCVKCSGGCKDGQCDPTTGACTCRTSLFTGEKCDRCHDGYFFSSGQFCYQCPSDCATCDGSSCISCHNGYYLQDSSCQECKTGCDQCSSLTTCIQCKDDYYMSGTDCVQCPDGCSDTCDKMTGVCICADNFVGENCDRCIDGKYGTNCNINCSRGCLNGICERESGHCDVCIGHFKGADCGQCEDNFSGATCDDCAVGRYGQDCDINCPVNCYGACNRLSGHCSICSNNFAGDNCQECTDGRYGTECQLNCPSNCKDRKCERGTGKCLGCSSGYYGDTCTLTCPPHWSNKTCDQNGVCNNGCVSGYSGDLYCLEGPNCKTCLSLIKCSVCLPGKYGYTCSMDCPTNCADKACDKVNGTCFRCADGYDGENCTVSLPSKGVTGAVIGGGIAGAVVAVIIVVVAVIILFRRRLAGMCSKCRSQPEENNARSTNVNVIGTSTGDTQERTKAIETLNKELTKYKHKEVELEGKQAKYARKMAQIQLQMKELAGHQTDGQVQDDVTSGHVVSTYEELNGQHHGEHPYTSLGAR